MKRMRYLRSLWQLCKRYGEENVVYFDESGFEKHSYRKCGWAKRGEKIYASVPGAREKRTNLIMAQRGKQWIAAETFEGSCDWERVNKWIKMKLFPTLKKTQHYRF